MFNYSSKEKRKFEEELYSAVVDEIQQKIINKGLWAKALADSGNDEKKTQALYIKYRVQKIKDEIIEKEEADRRKKINELEIENKQKKEAEVLLTLQTMVKKTVRTFKWLTFLMLFVGVLGLICCFIVYDPIIIYTNSYILLSFFSVSLIMLSCYLLFQLSKISKDTEYRNIRRRLNIFFLVLIPFSAIGTIIGLLLPMLALFMFLASIGMCIKAFKFNNAFAYAKRNNLI